MLMDKTYKADSVNQGGVSVCDAVNDEDAVGEATRDLQEQIKTSVTVKREKKNSVYSRARIT